MPDKKSKKRYRYYTYRGFDIDLKEGTLHNGTPCVWVNIRYSDTQAPYDEYAYWHGEPIDVVKTLVQVSLEEQLAEDAFDLNGSDSGFIPYAEKMRARKK